MNMRRRDLPAVVGLTFAATAMARGGPLKEVPPKGDGLSSSAETIHQDIRFNVAPNKVYETLLDTAAFDAVIKLGDAFKSGKLGKKPTAIDRQLGGMFTIFGGYIDGRQIELVPDKRIVQVWREEIWPEGIYSIVRFELSAVPDGSLLSFDHTGFPKGAGPHLASGWYGDYWNPMKAFFQHRSPA